MLYDLASSPPEPGSLLESIFLLITTRKREAELYHTEALISAMIGVANKDFEGIEKALESYKNAMFPFLEGERVNRAEMAKAALKQWTDHKAFTVKPLWQSNNPQQKRVQSQLRKSAERTHKAEQLRDYRRHTRI